MLVIEQSTMIPLAKYSGVIMYIFWLHQQSANNIPKAKGCKPSISANPKTKNKQKNKIYFINL